MFDPMLLPSGIVLGISAIFSNSYVIFLYIQMYVQIQGYILTIQLFCIYYTYIHIYILYIMLKLIHKNLYKTSQFIKLSRLQGKYNSVARLQLHNPKKKNALSIALLDQLDNNVKLINKQHDLRAVILTSSQQGYFCAGADLKERLDKSSQDIENIVYNLRRIFNDVRNIHCPVICVIDGPALGGGLELALNADIRIATKNSLIGLPETYWSLIPGAGGTQTLARTIGVAKAKQLIFTARKLNGDQAKQLGIVNYTQQNFKQGEKRALSLIDQMLPNGPLGIKHAKRAINWGVDVDLRTGLEIQRFNYQRIVHSEDRKQGFKAFSQKRKPNYSGK